MSADPNVTSVGGTGFTPIYVGGVDQGYATESVWNDPAGATGGGASQIFSKPAFQTGSGVPNDNARDVPDIALIASPYSPGVFWADDQSGSPVVTCCIGGTSLSAPLWAGFATVLGQEVGNRLGNLDLIIYPLANSSYGTAGFHDVTTGNNNFNGVTGFNAGPGYDQVHRVGHYRFQPLRQGGEDFSRRVTFPNSDRQPGLYRDSNGNARRDGYCNADCHSDPIFEYHVRWSRPLG